MKITIESDNISIIINIEKDKTISNLKTKIWLLTDIPFSYIELWYNGIQLDNQNTLEDYHILMDSKIKMNIKINKH
jgi:hypothetical protein